MAKKHFNPITGEISKCSAKEGNCPFIQEMIRLGGDPYILHDGDMTANIESWMTELYSGQILAHQNKKDYIDGRMLDVEKDRLKTIKRELASTSYFSGDPEEFKPLTEKLAAMEMSFVAFGGGSSDYEEEWVDVELGDIENFSRISEEIQARLFRPEVKNEDVSAELVNHVSKMLAESYFFSNHDKAGSDADSAMNTAKELREKRRIEDQETLTGIFVDEPFSLEDSPGVFRFDARTASDIAKVSTAEYDSMTDTERSKQKLLVALGACGVREVDADEALSLVINFIGEDSL